MNEYEKHNIKISKNTENLIIGMILSDARLQRMGKFSRMTIEQKDKDFVNHIWEILNKERLVSALPTKRIKNNEFISYIFNTITQPYLNDQYNIWYQQEECSKNKIGYKNIKIVPRQYLIDKLNMDVLIYMIAGDGYYEKANEFIGICTDSFSKEEIEFQINIIEKNINIKCSLMKHKNRYRIRINKLETIKLLIKINDQQKKVDYILIPKGMEYKFGIKKEQ